MTGFARHVAHIGDLRNSYNILIVKHEAKHSPGSSKDRGRDSINANLTECEVTET
jgi:hypothetical protein